MFVGDAIADPLTGLTAAALAMSIPPGGAQGGMLWDISMTDVVAATRTRNPLPVTRFREGGWFVETDWGAIPVHTPQARQPSGPTAQPGADTADVLRSLRIPAA